MYKYADSSMSDNVKYLLKQSLIHGKYYEVTCLFTNLHLYSQLPDSVLISVLIF